MVKVELLKVHLNSEIVYFITRLNSEKFQVFNFLPKVAIFE